MESLILKNLDVSLKDLKICKLYFYTFMVIFYTKVLHFFALNFTLIVYIYFLN